MSPSRVITRASSSTVRYASFWRTLASRSGSISSRAVARRMVPSLWTAPCASTKPRGSVKANSVFTSGSRRQPPLHQLEPFVGDLDLLDRDLVRARVRRPVVERDRPALLERERRDHAALVVVQRDRPVAADGRVLDALVDDLLPPVPQGLVPVDAARER